jgi:cell shape-determining protein MreC
MSKRYLPGNGHLKVGDRVVYVGKPSRYVQDCAIGTVAIVTKDMGFDYRYILDNGQRTGGYGWQKDNPE